MLNGTKMWITNGNLADVATVWAQTDDGIRGFLVPTGTGIHRQPHSPQTLLRASVTSNSCWTTSGCPHRRNCRCHRTRGAAVVP